MNFDFLFHPIPNKYLNDPATLKLLIGLCLIGTGLLMFSIWKERFFSIKKEARLQFLLFRFAGGLWAVGIFAICGGLYFLAS